MSDDDPEALDALFRFYYRGDTEAIHHLEQGPDFRVEHRNLPQGHLTKLLEALKVADKYDEGWITQWVSDSLAGSTFHCSQCLQVDYPSPDCVDLHKYPQQVLQALKWLWDNDIGNIVSGHLEEYIFANYYNILAESEPRLHLDFGSWLSQGKIGKLDKEHFAKAHQRQRETQQMAKICSEDPAFAMGLASYAMARQSKAQKLLASEESEHEETKKQLEELRRQHSHLSSLAMDATRNFQDMMERLDARTAQILRLQAQFTEVDDKLVLAERRIAQYELKEKEAKEKAQRTRASGAARRKAKKLRQRQAQSSAAVSTT